MASRSASPPSVELLLKNVISASSVAPGSAATGAEVGVVSGALEGGDIVGTVGTAGTVGLALGLSLGSTTKTMIKVNATGISTKKKQHLVLTFMNQVT